MSILIASRIWDNGDARLTGSRLVVLLCLAEYANDTGDCFPSVETLHKRARLSKVSVMTHLAELEALGYLRIERRQGAHNIYHITPEPVPTASEVTFRKSGNVANLKTSQDSATSQDDLTSQDSATTTSQAILTTTSQAILTTTSQAILTTPVKVTQHEPSVNPHKNRQGNQGEPPSPPRTQSATAGRNEADALQELNGRLGPQLRRPLADVVKDITGTKALSDLPSIAGQAANIAAHRTACDLWDMNCKTESQLLDLEAKWYADDWRGQKGDKPSCATLTTFASDQKGGNRRNGHAPPEVTSRPASINAAEVLK